jgi:hypothetical protein
MSRLPVLAVATLALLGGCRRREAALAELKAVAAGDQVGQAEALAAKLEGSEAEAPAQVLLADMYVRTRAPEAAAKLEGLSQRLVAGGHHAQAAAVARQQGRFAWTQSRYQDALVAFDLSIRQAELAGDEPLRKRGLLGLFTMLYELGDLRGAEAALKLATREPVGLDEELRATVAFDRGLLADAEGQMQLAGATFQEVLRSPAVKPTSELAWTTSLNLFALALDAGALPLAEEASRSVERIFAAGEFKTRPNSRIARGLYGARLAALRGQPAQALEQLAALDGEKPSQQWAWKLALERGRALLALQQAEQAVAAFEQSAAVVEALRGDQFDDFKSWVVAQRRAPYEALFELHAGRGDGLRALQIHERVQGRTFIEAFAANTAGSGATHASSRITWLRKLYPALRASPAVAEAPPVDELRARLKGVRALAYFETAQRLYVLSVAGGTVTVHPASAPLPAIRTLVARLMAAPNDATLAEQLGALLLPPPDKRGSEAPGLLFITPSAALARLPFAPLRRAGRALIEDHTLAQVPSLSALQALKRREPRPAGPPFVAILADASGDLPEAAAEARAVAERLGGGDPDAEVSLFSGADATRAHLGEARGARVLHLAVHSGVGATGPFLALADGPMLAGEVLDQRITADLVVLASCASAATPDPGLWGSLVASFLASGSPAVVGSLWSTKDQVSRAFVDRFYAEGGADDPAAALARAQRAWLSEGRPSADWAAFAFYGPGGR